MAFIEHLQKILEKFRPMARFIADKGHFRKPIIKNID